MTTDFSVRSIKSEELKQVWVWAEAEGWKPGPHDVECYYNSDREGFLLGEAAGEPVGCISATAYNDKFGFIAFFIVRPECRGRGYGAKLMEAAMTRLGNRVIGVDSVVPLQEFYEKTGFVKAFDIIRHAGKRPENLEHAGCIYGINGATYSRLYHYEKSVFADAARSFGEGLLSMPNSKGVYAINENGLKGFGIMRLCGKNYKIGPLFADNEKAGEKLLSALVKQTEGKTFFIDVPEKNETAMSLVNKYGLSPVGKVVRMYAPQMPATDLSKVFSIGIAAFA